METEEQSGEGFWQKFSLLIRLYSCSSSSSNIITCVWDIWNCCSYSHSDSERNCWEQAVGGSAIFGYLDLSPMGVLRQSLNQCFSEYEFHRVIYDADIIYESPSARHCSRVIIYRLVNWDQMKLSDWPRDIQLAGYRLGIQTKVL